MPRLRVWVHISNGMISPQEQRRQSKQTALDAKAASVAQKALATAAKKTAKAEAAQKASQEKAETLAKSTASAALDMLKVPLGDLQDMMREASRPDDYFSQACELLLNQAKVMMTDSLNTCTTGVVSIKFDLKELRIVQNDLVAKTRNPACSGAHPQYERAVTTARVPQHGCHNTCACPNTD